MVLVEVEVRTQSTNVDAKHVSPRDVKRVFGSFFFSRYASSSFILSICCFDACRSTNAFCILLLMLAIVFLSGK